MIKPDARIVPTQDEFDAWQLHPVTQFVAEAYRIAAETQRRAWEGYFHVNLIPADIAMKRLELRTREDAYNSFLETTFERYLELVEGPQSRPALRGAQGRRA